MLCLCLTVFFFFFKQKTAYEMRISDWSSDVCSSDLRFGRAARDAVERAREQLAVLVNCQPREIIWTSGGTESNNLALKGVTDGAVPSRVLYGATEHPAVLEAAESLHERGWIVETVAVDETGVIDWSRFRSEEHTSELQSLMRISYAVFCLKKKTNKQDIC